MGGSIEMSVGETPVNSDVADTNPLGYAAGQVILRPRKSQPFYARHPWVFDTAVERIEGDPKDGDVVDLISDKNRFIARGILNRNSRLRVRLYTWNAGEPIDDHFWTARISRSIQARRDLGMLGSDKGARLVFSESDGLSGLIVDQYGDYSVMQVNSLAVHVRRDTIINILDQLLHPRGIIVRNEKGIAKEEGIEFFQGLIRGALPDGPVFIEENGLKFGVDLQVGQKTGCYLDQSENRLAAARYFNGRRVLDMFCYAGGFSIAAARIGRAREVIAYDSSERAIAIAKANAELNGIPNIQFRVQDCFQALDQLKAEGERFGAIILDPPKFTRNRHNVEEALRAYFRINRLAIDLLEPGGILVTCSCSGSVSREDFANMLTIVSQKSDRPIQLLEQRGAAVDHPISVACPETEYLKCFICRAI